MTIFASEGSVLTTTFTPNAYQPAAAAPVANSINKIKTAPMTRTLLIPRLDRDASAGPESKLLASDLSLDNKRETPNACPHCLQNFQPTCMEAAHDGQACAAT